MLSETITLTTASRFPASIEASNKRHVYESDLFPQNCLFVTLMLCGRLR